MRRANAACAYFRGARNALNPVGCSETPRALERGELRNFPPEMKPRSARADERPTRCVSSEGSETRESRGSVRQGASEDRLRARVRRNGHSPASLWSFCNAVFDQSGWFAGTFFCS